MYLTPCVQERLGVARRLYAALEDQVGGGFERGRAFKVGAHGGVRGVASVLLINHFRYALEGLLNAGRIDDAMMQQLAMCWLEIRNVARSSIRPTL